MRNVQRTVCLIMAALFVLAAVFSVAVYLIY